MTRVLPCTCSTQNEFQDNLYGKNKRLYNQGGKEPTKYKCTVCGREVRLNK